MPATVTPATGVSTAIPPTGVTPAIGTSATGDTGHGVSATGTSDAGLCVGGSHAGSQDEEVLPVISISINDFQNPDNYNEDDYPGTNISMYFVHALYRKSGNFRC